MASLSKNDPDFSNIWIAELNENIDKCNAEDLDYLLEREGYTALISSDS